MKKEKILRASLLLALGLFMAYCFLQMCDETPRDITATLIRKLTAALGFCASAATLARLRRAGII